MLRGRNEDDGGDVYAVVAGTTVFRKYGDQYKIKISDKGDTCTYRAMDEVTDKFEDYVPNLCADRRPRRPRR